MEEKLPARRAVIFDADGTLWDPHGIPECYHATLTHLGLPAPELEALRWCVGPPLEHNIALLLEAEIGCEAVAEATRIYRSLYRERFIFKCSVYPGIPECLEAVGALNAERFVATSKYEEAACAIVERFSLAPFFRRVCGSVEQGRSQKEEIIRDLLSEETIDPRRAVMIGDTKFDMIGAQECGIFSIGITWGYGSEEELRDHGAISIAHSPEELLQVIGRHFRWTSGS